MKNDKGHPLFRAYIAKENAIHPVKSMSEPVPYLNGWVAVELYAGAPQQVFVVLAEHIYELIPGLEDMDGIPIYRGDILEVMADEYEDRTHIKECYIDISNDGSYVLCECATGDAITMWQDGMHDWTSVQMISFNDEVVTHGPHISTHRPIKSSDKVLFDTIFDMTGVKIAAPDAANIMKEVRDLGYTVTKIAKDK